jgi:hypothetical protein
LRSVSIDAEEVLSRASGIGLRPLYYEEFIPMG